MSIAIAIGLIAAVFLLLLIMSAIVLWHLTEPPPPAEEEMQDYLDFLAELRRGEFHRAVPVGIDDL